MPVRITLLSAASVAEGHEPVTQRALASADRLVPFDWLSVSASLYARDAGGPSTAVWFVRNLDCRNEHFADQVVVWDLIVGQDVAKGRTESTHGYRLQCADGAGEGVVVFVEGVG